MSNNFHWAGQLRAVQIAAPAASNTLHKLHARKSRRDANEQLCCCIREDHQLQSRSLKKKIYTCIHTNTCIHCAGIYVYIHTIYVWMPCIFFIFLIISFLMIFNVYIYTYTCINVYGALSQLASRWQYLIALAADVDRGKSTNQTGLKPRNKSGVAR